MSSWVRTSNSRGVGAAYASALMAERADMSLMTLRAIERGSLKVAMGNYMFVLYCFGSRSVFRMASPCFRSNASVRPKTSSRSSL